VPAPAVIPAFSVYMIVAVVKTFVAHDPDYCQIRCSTKVRDRLQSRIKERIFLVLRLVDALGHFPQWNLKSFLSLS